MLYYPFWFSEGDGGARKAWDAVNGEPEPNRDVVRMSLMDLRKRYVYFAKIQFEPRNTMGDLKTTQKRALEFYETMLPEMLKQLPTQKEIKQLRKSD